MGPYWVFGSRCHVTFVPQSAHSSSALGSVVEGIFALSAIIAFHKEALSSVIRELFSVNSGCGGKRCTQSFECSSFLGGIL